MLAAKLANKGEKAGGDGGFTVSLQQPQARALGASDEEEKQAGVLELVST